MSDPAGNEALARIGELLAALAEVHTARAFERAVETTFDRWIPGARLQRDAGNPRGAGAVELAPGLVITRSRGGALPAFLSDAPFLAAVRAALEMTRHHLAVLHRVAGVSRRAHVERKELRADLERLAAPGRPVARSAQMRDVLARAALVARHPTTVLVTGESGTGKEVVAHEIHRQSPRAHRPMQQINCAVLPVTLAESELFGHVRGSFTGANTSHPGVFERADGGTLFLDEIGDLPLPAQAKLLRVLQERKVRPIGATDMIDVDVRVIAATNHSLEALVREGRFREDLRFRLDVFAIHIPPLRERKDDLAPLVSALLADIAARFGIDRPRVPTSVMTRLEAHHWPGNVRELANVLEAATIMATDGVLALPADFAPAAFAPKRSRPFDASVRQVIEAALRASRGKLYGPGGAAERLGLKPGTLQSKMRKLGIDRARFV